MYTHYATFDCHLTIHVQANTRVEVRLYLDKCIAISCTSSSVDEASRSSRMVPLGGPPELLKELFICITAGKVASVVVRGS